MVLPLPASPMPRNPLLPCGSSRAFRPTLTVRAARLESLGSGTARFSTPADAGRSVWSRTTDRNPVVPASQAVGMGCRPCLFSPGRTLATGIPPIGEPGHFEAARLATQYGRSTPRCVRRTGSQRRMGSPRDCRQRRPARLGQSLGCVCHQPSDGFATLAGHFEGMIVTLQRGTDSTPRTLRRKTKPLERHPCPVVRPGLQPVAWPVGSSRTHPRRRFHAADCTRRSERRDQPAWAWLSVSSFPKRKKAGSLPSRPPNIDLN